MPDDLKYSDPECQHKHITASVKTPVDPDATIDVECFMSTDSVDADDEVMLPDGVELSRFNKNPVVMLCHAIGQPGCFYPLPVGKALWTKQAKRGVLAGVRFSRDTEMGRQVKSLFDEGMLQSFSVGFRPLQVSMMTRKEADSRPDWKEAFERTKGQIRVHRKWHMVELSVAPVPSNPDALVTSYKAKGILVPDWLKPSLESGKTMPTDTTPTAQGGGESEETPVLDLEVKAVESEPEAEEKAPCACEKADCKECSERMKLKADEEENSKEESEETEATAEAAPEPDPDDFDEEDESELPIKTRDHVDVKSKGFRGCGVVEKIHRRGLVEHVDEDVVGTRDEPAARVRLYKAHSDGHNPTDRRMGCKLKELTRRGEPLKAPTKKAFEDSSKATPVTKNSPMGEKPEPLPVIVVKSDQEVRAELIAKLNEMLSPEGFRRIAREEAERAAGFV